MSGPRTRVGRFIFYFLLATCINLTNGFTFMLAIGTIHAEWIHSLPTIGYWWAVLVALLLRGTFTPVQRKPART